MFRETYEITVPGKNENFLNMSIIANGDKVHLHNELMVETVLKYFSMSEFRRAAGTLLTGLGLGMKASSSTALSGYVLYQRLAGSLMHLANTLHPDVNFGVSYLARFMHQPTIALWISAKNVWRYLQGSLKGVFVCIQKGLKAKILFIFGLRARTLNA